jgi:paraquat-inducible protein B
MSRKANPSLIGAFVLGAIAVAVVGVVMLGGGHWFTERATFGVFFDGSVNGLYSGSPVSFRGVKIGEVTDTRAIYDPDSADIKIQAIFYIVPDRIAESGKVAENDPYGAAMFLVRRGLRAKLVMQSFVTGQLYIDLDFYPDTPIRLVGLDRDTREFPAVPSGLQELENQAREAFETLRSLPLEETFTRLNSALTGVDELVHSEDVLGALADLRATTQSIRSIAAGEEIAGLISDLRAVIGDLRGFVQQANERIMPVADRVAEAVSQADATLAQAEKTLAEGQIAVRTVADLVSEDGDLYYRFSTTLEQLERAVRSLRVLADFLERHPEALFKGKEGSLEQ